ncbi:class II aldolase/adducin family protein [Pseudonocardia sp. HH130630-07]|uniref:class II aldolase/adducin family protein n=1 Tax=Pseudonocardia sp. HH130630-07 TaxID=1690815 RepID=UPI000814D5B2|nr:class II aldolase/adducin family protein [Pseudonocardia sp. HH130630-07]ANY08832.1 ribulose phosphate epimerase [Pseudonocardia sp. HH130630-07]
MTADPRQLVALASRVLADQGQDDFIWGHASVRDERGCWIKSAEWSLAEVTADRVQLVGGDGAVLDGDGPRHSEYPIHTEVLAARPDVGAVVHTHPPHAVALAAAGQELLPVSHAATMFVPPAVPRFTDTADLILTPELGARVAAALGDAPALFLVNHGIVAVGPDLQTATVRAVVLEQACRQQLLTRSFGGRPSWSPDEEARAKREHVYNDRAVHAVWDLLVRRLPA